jgi:hypothetical protein
MHRWIDVHGLQDQRIGNGRIDGGTGWCRTHCWCHVGLTAGAKDGIALGLIIGLDVRLATGIAIGGLS